MPHSTVTRKGQTTIPGRFARRCKSNPAISSVRGGRRPGHDPRASRHAVAEGCAGQQEGEEDEFRRNPRSRREGGPRPREYPMSAKRRLVDTNIIIVRYLVQDHEKACQAAGKLLKRAIVAMSKLSCCPRS